jgi:hypothetical protein
MMPKDLVPLIGTYLTPNVYQLYVRIPERLANPQRYLILATSEDHAYEKVCNTHDLLIALFRYLSICVVTPDDLQRPITESYRQIEHSRMYHYYDGNAHRSATERTLSNRCADITLRNTQICPVTVDELKLVLSSSFFYQLYGPVEFHISLTQIKTY